MKAVKQLVKETKLSGDIVTSEIIHIYSENGHFERDGKYAGWHIQIGTDDKAENYTEVLTEEVHTVPDSLPDIIITEEDAEEATIEDYKEALKELGVNVDEESET